MYPPHYVIASALKAGAEAIGSSEASFRAAFAKWPSSEVTDLWAAWGNESTRPVVRLSKSREAPNIPQWTVHLRGSQPVGQFANGGKSMQSDGSQLWQWIEEFGVEVETTAPNPRATAAWWWLSKCAVQAMQPAILAASTVTGLRHGNTIPMSDDELTALMPELGHTLSAWWHLTMDCYAPVLPGDLGTVTSALVLAMGYFDDAGNEGGMPV